MYKALFLLIILLNSKVFAIEFQGKFIQGHFIIGKTEPNSEIWRDKKQVKLTKDGFFVFGMDNLLTGSIDNISHLDNNKNFEF